MKDTFYDYRKFEDERLRGIMTGWDGLGGNHGSVVKFCAELLEGETVLDVGFGLCHLYEALKSRVSRYVGVDIDERALRWAKERHPTLELYYASVYDLSLLRNRIFNTVFAIGLYRIPHQLDGIEEMLKHTQHSLVVTYFQPSDSDGKSFPAVFWGVLDHERVKSVEVFSHGNKGTEIVRFNVTTNE